MGFAELIIKYKFMKLIKILFLILLVIFSSCGDGFDDYKCAKLVKETFPGQRIFIESPHYTYLIIDTNGNIRRAVIAGGDLTIDRVEEFIEVK